MANDNEQVIASFLLKLGAQSERVAPEVISGANQEVDIEPSSSNIVAQSSTYGVVLCDSDHAESSSPQVTSTNVPKGTSSEEGNTSADVGMKMVATPSTETPEASEVRRKRKYKKRVKDPVHKFPVQPRVIQTVKKPKTTMDHSYRDFSCVPPLDGEVVPTDPNQMSFPEKVHHILSQEKYSLCISWMPHGRAFKVILPNVLEKEVLYDYFGNKRYSSFLTSLKQHDFKMITLGMDRCCFYHECFLRGHPHLIKYMPLPRARRNLQPDPENEPDLYLISKLFPVDSKLGAEGNSGESNSNNANAITGSDTLAPQLSVAAIAWLQSQVPK